ncbi:hypothetical protein ACOSP7_016576 [Xanthoceras sorbifolium]
MDLDVIAKQCANLSLIDDDVPVATIVGELHDKGVLSVSMSLIGSIIAYKEVNRNAFKAMILKVWRITKEVDIELIRSNIFVFRFKCRWDRKRVFEGGLWLFDKQLIVLKEIPGIGKIEEINFHFSPFWIQLYNLPLERMS